MYMFLYLLILLLPFTSVFDVNAKKKKSRQQTSLKVSAQSKKKPRQLSQSIKTSSRRRKRRGRSVPIQKISPSIPVVSNFSAPVPTTLRQLKTSIDKLVQQAGKSASIGIKIVSLKNNAVIYEKNAHKHFIPASNTKLITGAAAFHILGPDYSYVTKLYTDKRSSPHSITNLYIKGAGDPTLTPSDLGTLARSLKKLGIHEIKGNLIFDSTIFNQQGTGPGWSKGDGSIYCKAPTGGLMVSHSIAQVRVSPSVPGRPPTISIDPYSRYFKVVNKAKTTTRKDGGIRVLRMQGNVLLIQGTISRRSRTKYYKIAVEQPSLFAASVFEAELRKNRLILKGTIKQGTVPDSAQELGHHYSERLSSLVYTMMKMSDNLYADALFRTMGTHLLGTPGTWTKGSQAVKQFLEKTVQLAPENMMLLMDGSGMSHANRVSPESMYELLSWVYHNSLHKDLFINSLPLGGIDGTLRHRIKPRSIHASVHAKTGNLTGVTSLSGYVIPKNGHPLIFVIMVNRKNKSVVHLKRRLEDQICHLLTSHTFGNS